MRLFQKRLAFGSPDMAISLLFATVNGWLIFYLINIAGMPAFSAGFVLVFGRLLDGFLDPVIGAWTDGRKRKPVIAAALPLAATAFVAIWIMPIIIPELFPKILATTMALSLFVLGYTCISVPRLGMLRDFAPGYHDRTSQTAVDTSFVFIALLISSAALPAFVAILSKSHNLSDSEPYVWIKAITGIAMLSVIFYLPFILFIREPRRNFGNRVYSSPFVTLKELRETKGALRIIAVFGTSILALVTLQSILPFWLEAGPSISAKEQSLVLLLVFTCTLISLPLWTMISRHLGKLSSLRIGGGVFLFGLLLAVALPEKSGLNLHLILAAIIIGNAVGALSMFPWAMVPDMAEAHSNRLGEAVEGTTSASFTMINKIAVAAALLANSILLQLIASLNVSSAMLPGFFLMLPFIFGSLMVLLAKPVK